MIKKSLFLVKKVLIFCLIFAWVFSGWPQVFNFPPSAEKAQAVVGIGTITTGQANKTTSFTISGHVVSGVDRVLYVLTSATTKFSDDGQFITSIVWDVAGVNEALTLVGRIQGAGTQQVTEIWRRINPTAKTANITISSPKEANWDGVVASAVTVTGVNQTTPNDTYKSNSSTLGVVASVTVDNSATNDLVLAAMAGFASAGETCTVGGTATQRWNILEKKERGCGSSDAGAASVLMSWTLSGSINWAANAISINPAITTIGNGTNPGNSTVGPGTAITDLDAFTLVTSGNTDSVTAATVTLGPAGAFNNIGEVRITNSAGTVIYFSAITNPASNTVNLSGGTPMPVTSTNTIYKIRITPKTHVNMPAVPGASYNTTGTITAFTSTNAQAGVDTDSATITVDNASPGAATSTSGTPSDAQVQLDWTNPSDADFTTGGQVVVLRRAGSTVANVPAEGVSYAVGNTIGTATVGCVVSGSPPATTCTDTGLTNGTAYHYKIFTKDSRGNYNTGTVPSGSPFTPTATNSTLTQNYFRFYADNDALDPTDPWPVGATDLGENAEITSLDQPPASGERFRIRMSIAVSDNQLSASGQDFKLQFGIRSTTCGAIASWTDLGNPGSGANWRGYNATPTDGTNLSGNPPTGGDLNLSVSDRAGTYEEQNNTPLNSFTVATGEDIEYDWVVEDNGATGGFEYCFRMAKADNSALDGYNFYPALVTSGYRPESKNWRWYDDETNETPSTALASENVAPANVANNNIVKLRLSITETAGAGGTNIKFKIQFSEYSDFSQAVVDAVELGACTANSLWCYGDGTDTDDDVVTSGVLSDSTANGVHNESGVSSSSFDPLASTVTEYEFTLKHAGARANVTYFFRAYDVANNLPVPLNAGETYPSLATEGALLDFTVAGLSASTATEGVTTDITTSSASIPFGALAFDTEVEGAQRLTINTNATEGYQIFLFERQNLLHNAYGGVLIDPVTGTNTSPVGWVTGCVASASGCYGYHTGDDTLSGGSTRFSADDTYAQFTTSLEEVAFSGVPVSNEVVDFIFKTKITNQQPAGAYSSQVVYVAVPVF